MIIGILSSFFGLAYDIEWHSDVGPDTFFTLPHLFLYAGVAITELTAILFALLRQLFFGVLPWATSAYATSLGLFLRDDADRIPELPLLMPVFLIGSAIIIDLLLWVGQRQKWPVRRTVMVAALLSVLLIVLSFVWSGTYTPEINNGFGWEEPLTRFPRLRSVWGMDVRSLPVEGDWRIKFTIDGPGGKAEGWSQPITLLPPPGPPKWISWSIGALPLFALITLIIVGWRQVRLAQIAETYAWR